ncbi:hypothetical protein BH18THE2_BH18THE2_23350 [soil metagenome]
MVAKKNKDFIQEESRVDGTPVGIDVIQRVRAVGIDPSAILADIVYAIRNVNISKPDGVCTDSDVKIKKKALIEKIQQILSKYGLNELEVGSYPDSFVMDGYTEVRLMLSSSGCLYERYHDSRTQYIELSSYVLEELHSPKHILSNLFASLIEMTEKNKAKIKGIEDFANDSSLGTVST